MFITFQKAQKNFTIIIVTKQQIKGMHLLHWYLQSFSVLHIKITGHWAIITLHY